MTPKRSKFAIAVLFCIGAIAVIAFLNHENEPRYEGKTLSEWLAIWVRHAGDLEGEKSERAVRAIGTNAIPTCLKWIRFEPSPLWQKIATLVKRLPAGLRRDVDAVAEARANQAVTVFQILGGEARAAIPELTRLAQTYSHPARANRCVRSLNFIGPEALPSFLTLATNSPLESRILAIFTLSNFKDTKTVVPALIQCLDDNDSRISDVAAQVLGGFERSALLPSLTNALHSDSAQVRWRAVGCIEWIKSPAPEAVSVLLPMLTDPSAKVREITTNALLRIAPEVLTNAPPQ